MKRPSLRVARAAKWAALPVAVLASGLIISIGSYSAFKSTTSNPGSAWNAGAVVLADDDSDTALFQVGQIAPGFTGTNCISVSSTGTVPAEVRLYATNGATTKALSSYLDLTITQGTGGGFGSCAGFSALGSGSSVYAGTLAAFISGHADYANGVLQGANAWQVTGSNPPDNRTYKITWTVNASTPNTVQGGTAGLDFTWESQSL
jgi:hypothetical protein